MTVDRAPVYWRDDEPPQGTCPVCDGCTWIYYNGGRTTCDGCGGDGRNHYPPDRPQLEGVSVTPYGFAWGPMLVERLAHIEGRGYVLQIKTAHQSMQVYVSEAGRVIRAEEVRNG